MSQQQPWKDTDLYDGWGEREAAYDRARSALLGGPDTIILSAEDASKILDAAVVGLHAAHRAAALVWLKSEGTKSG